MPAKYAIDRERKLIISSAWGTMTDDDVLEHHRSLRTDPDFDPTFRQLIDMSGITEDRVAVTTKELVSRDQIFARSGGGTLRALKP